MIKTLKNISTANIKTYSLLILWFFVFVLHAFPTVEIFRIRVDYLSFILFTSFSCILLFKEMSQNVINTPIKYFLAFVVLVTIVNGVHSNSLGDLEFTSLYLGLLLFSLAALACLQRNFQLFVRWMVIGSIIGLSISCIYGIFDTHFSARAFFTNTNQFARFGLFFSVICSLLVFKKKWIFNDLTFAFIIGMGLFSAIAPVRRSAILGWIILFLFLFYYKRKIIIPATIVCIGFLSLFYLFSPYNLQSHLDKAEKRISPEFQVDGNYLFDRGYEVILKYPEKMIFGAGESNIHRFPIKGKTPRAIHSIYLNILFCYGIGGLVLFLFYLFRMIDFKRKSSLLFLPVLIHSLLHNDIRNIYFLIIPLLFYLSYNVVLEEE